MIAIIDYGVGNLYSLSCSLKFLGIDCIITADKEKIKEAQRLILPGVGAFADAYTRLQKTGLVPVVLEEAAKGKPLLGICLGMQLLFEESFEYGHCKGLGLIRGSVCPLEPDLRSGGFDYKVPQMGWNSLNIKKSDNPLMKNTENGEYVYYVHSFYAKNCEASIVASSDYGIEVTGVAANKNVYGCQFHPEKSGKTGLRILQAFNEISTLLG